jgi:hypothetical protein
LIQAGCFAGTEVGSGMENKKWQTELISSNQFLGQGAKRVGVKDWIGGGEIDQVIGVSKNGMQPDSFGMVEKRRDLVRLERSCEPLHIVLHENLHRGALNRTGPFNGPMGATRDRHVRA